MLSLFRRWMRWGFLKREVITIKAMRIYMNVQNAAISLLKKLKAIINAIFADIAEASLFIEEKLLPK